MSSKRKPEPAKPEATTTTRRVGQRTRLQPLAWWSNERKNYEASENGPVLTGVLSPGEGKIKPLTGSSPSPPHSKRKVEPRRRKKKVAFEGGYPGGEAARKQEAEAAAAAETEREERVRLEEEAKAETAQQAELEAEAAPPVGPPSVSETIRRDEAARDDLEIEVDGARDSETYSETSEDEAEDNTTQASAKTTEDKMETTPSPAPARKRFEQAEAGAAEGESETLAPEQRSMEAEPAPAPGDAKLVEEPVGKETAPPEAPAQAAAAAVLPKASTLKLPGIDITRHRHFPLSARNARPQLPSSPAKRVVSLTATGLGAISLKTAATPKAVAKAATKPVATAPDVEEEASEAAYATLLTQLRRFYGEFEPTRLIERDGAAVKEIARHYAVPGREAELRQKLLSKYGHTHDLMPPPMSPVPAVSAAMMAPLSASAAAAPTPVMAAASQPLLALDGPFTARALPIKPAKPLDSPSPSQEGRAAEPAAAEDKTVTLPAGWEESWGRKALYYVKRNGSDKEDPKPLEEDDIPLAMRIAFQHKLDLPAMQQ
ncbi:hypothetical protein EMIHUDRAFT_245309 [Emiliania huxleyi CCMP1516]|uniref:WW domain-containing protein n=2 Tax=Emiliania huxleyi TaxID=2903 RepID=A0A0D3IY03_EMIH1|nr:hypothetical protein EMIHUDRAFT_245309 [Emiliania huxleyi CCMP1516]EOD16138.1 hypothetical protein EMIHUDRAFT_245309 [Emiliania huxleyi CCMP1516]|eukprot:XP_005768567.1 hypothetical protein EMIHUDRAFT_245309 [Emiliania huxleyi CCMP1516]